jgi:tetratricopeptide (TPR) repeat protein
MVIRLDLEHDAAYNNRGADKASLGHHDAAISDFDAAIRLNPDDMEAYFNRGFSKKKLGHAAEANQDLQKALSLAQEAGDAELITTIKKHI